ncbi:hypothetical protein EMGBS1_01040 [Chloroflexota bacterium]|nr:hypothetical protein EMGBS1_01040 [Chloroflexota bacterium]
MYPTLNFDELYASARSGCVLLERASVGRVWMQGRDRLDLLHRMSTNDMTGMALNTVRQTVLTNHLGRIVDCVEVLNLPDGALLLTSPDQSGAVRAWLARHVFFQDDVQLRDTTAEMANCCCWVPVPTRSRSCYSPEPLCRVCSKWCKSARYLWRTWTQAAGVVSNSSGR